MQQPPRSKTSDVAPDRMALVSEIMMAQALTLDGMFNELLGHAAESKGPLTADRYTRLALRAQAGCRSSLMALVRAEREKRPPQSGQASQPHSNGE